MMNLRLIFFFIFQLIASVALTFTALIVDIFVLMEESGFIKFDEAILRLLIAQITLRNIFTKTV